MFNPLKAASDFTKGIGDLNAMRKQAAQIQAALEQEEFEIKEGNVRILISGNQNVRVIEIDGVANETLKRAINDAVKKSQQAAAMKLTELSKQMGQ
ncbi:MAG: YbaB/EbfC family nucleoid-associated protein [Candidatus Gottesmanbacteria bacterium]|nr:YbaB/EbfC family nucleoid-associated protein [Candidatus Gottesmanbacteria bacterium]